MGTREMKVGEAHTVYTLEETVSRVKQEWVENSLPKYCLSGGFLGAAG